MSMPRKLVRAFQRADDVLEYCLIRGTQRVRRSWKAWTVLATVSMAAWSGWTPPPPPPPAATGLPALALPDPEPLVMPDELDLIDEELALWDEQLEIDREPSGLLDLKLSIGVDLPQTTFDVLKVDRAPAGVRARIRFNGSVLEVREGSIVPSVDAPSFVVTDIGPDRILALDVWSHRILDREVPPEALWTESLKIVAIAGEAPDFVAVVEFDKDTHIVQPGSRIPDEGMPRISIARVFADRLVYTIMATGEERVIHHEEPRDPLEDIETIDIPDISP